VSHGRSPLGDRNFQLYFGGVIASEIGVRGTLAINLYHVFVLTDSTVLTGLVGLFQAIALLVLSPLGGAYADRLDRRRLVQAMQAVSLVVSAGLGVLTFAGMVTAWHIYVAVMLNTAAATFDHPARQALIPAIVPPHQLIRAFALVSPAREIAMLVGPALGGLLVAVGGPGLMYAVDAVSYLALIFVLVALRLPPTSVPERRPSVASSIREGAVFVRRRPVIWQLMGLDVVATMFGAYRVVLPAIALQGLGLGATGYGLLAAAVPAGALIGSAVIYRMVDDWRAGRVVIASTIAYGVACLAFAQSPGFAIALVAAAAIGGTDALASAIRHAAVQVETPDVIRGRVSAIYQMASRGGPALGDANVGWMAGLLGPVGALSLGAMAPVVVAALTGIFGRVVPTYQVPSREVDASLVEAVVVEDLGRGEPPGGPSATR
jgi:MFS family permease